MRITKDEARILADAISEEKYNIVENLDPKISTLTMGALQDLEDRLTEYGQDARRNGRTSQNDFTDLLKRFTNKFLTKKFF